MRLISDDTSKCGNYRLKLISQDPGEAGLHALEFLEVLSEQHESDWVLSAIVPGQPCALFYSKLSPQTEELYRLR